MRTLLVEVDSQGIRVSRIHKDKEPLAIDWIHDPVLGCYLEVLAQGSSMGDALRAMEEQVRGAANDPG